MEAVPGEIGPGVEPFLRVAYAQAPRKVVVSVDDRYGRAHDSTLSRSRRLLKPLPRRPQPLPQRARRPVRYARFAAVIRTVLIW
ncbi:hypothetical protein GCM10007977_038550 [Dactylosporangium sucinum]|uniref:Uncharacterized protein n=1 Tax=Dactylosporangium sucinum TaxID=1424081 RepID=A0A917TRA5_9ACTN|nr:hypothetical protein GCM10007977_038550 [Dactylosporangium sucinum]